MPKFMLLVRQSLDNAQCQPPSPDEIQQAMTHWHAWMAKFKKSGQLLDGGDGLTPGGKVIRSGGVVTDGPFVETKEVIGGFSLLQAESLEAAVAVAMECPAAHAPGASIEVREFAGYA